MDLFRGNREQILPRDGEAIYHSPVFSEGESAEILSSLLAEIPWQSDEVVMFGKRIVTARQVAWFADDQVPYSYSGTTRTAHPWSPRLTDLREKAEQLTGTTYNSCLLNLYHHGEEGMGWHSDDEKAIVPGSSIASLSFGAERKFAFKHKQTKEAVSLLLENGSLLDMRGETQRHWLHQLPKTKKISTPRVNLTFRMIRE